MREGIDVLTDLGRRVVMCRGWRWLEGTKLLDGRRVVAYTYDEQELLYCTNRQLGCFGKLTEGGCLPDLSDAATRGCALSLVRQAWTMPRATAVYDPSRALWYVREHSLAVNALGKGPNEAEALVVALEAAPWR